MCGPVCVRAHRYDFVFCVMRPIFHCCFTLNALCLAFVLSVVRLIVDVFVMLYALCSNIDAVDSAVDS